jgi:glycerophosphoryl diester phosphodiesterase
MNRREFVATVAALATAPGFGAVVPAKRHRPVVVAHRGDHTQAHENSLAALEAAIRVGADFVEVDVRRCQGGEHLLMHDSTVDRTTTGRGKVAELTWPELAGLRLADRGRPSLVSEPVPSFADALRVMRGRIGLYLDFKDGDRETVVRALRGAGMVERTVVYDDLENVPAWRQIAPELPLMVSPRPTHLKGDGLKQMKEHYPVEVLDGPATEYSAEVVKAVQALGFEVWMDIQGTWESPEFWRRMLALGADGWQSDKPGELIAFLRAEGRR